MDALYEEKKPVRRRKLAPVNDRPEEWGHSLHREPRISAYDFLHRPVDPLRPLATVVVYLSSVVAPAAAPAADFTDLGAELRGPWESVDDIEGRVLPQHAAARYCGIDV